jgi:ATP-dependent DNA helicase DinG
VHEFFDLLPPHEGRSALEPGARAAFLEEHKASYDGLVAALKALEGEIAALLSKPEELLVIARRAAELRTETAFLFESNEKNYVYWLERRGKGVFIVATPIDVSSILREHLFDAFDTIVMTSATLAVSGRFDFLKQRLGMQLAQETVLPHEFDYGRQALLYIPAGLPDVRNPAFVPKAAEEISRLLKLTQGRAFCLFTSYGQMNQIYELVRARVRFPLLLQGTAPRMALLERFRTTPGAVLFATSSFWQGVDVPGEQLSCVIIDRLPFAVPTDPVVAARVRMLTEEGRNAFAEYQIPEAVLALKQGFGRLIRTRTDRGVLAILDNRIQRMQYGKIFVESLPEYSLTRDIAEVQRFMKAPS